jgi:dephospho-CoA kinase
VPESVQLERTMRRDDNSAELVHQIMDAQINRDDRLNAADMVIDNSGSLENLYEQVDLLHEQLVVKASALEA